LHNQNVTRIAFHRNRVLLSGFARQLTGYLDRFSCLRECSSEGQAVMVRNMLVHHILNLPPLCGRFARMTRVLGAAANGVALRLRAIEIFGQTFSAQLRICASFFGWRQTEFTMGRHVVEQKARRDCVSCIFKLLERLAPSVHRRSGTLGAFGADARWRWTLRVSGEH
jgi:hypothetical protein